MSTNSRHTLISVRPPSFLLLSPLYQVHVVTMHKQKTHSRTGTQIPMMQTCHMYHMIHMLRSIVPNKLSLSLSHCFLLIIIMRTSVFIRAHMYMHADIQLLPKSLQHALTLPPLHCLCPPSVPAPGFCGVMMRQLPAQMPISADPVLVVSRQRPKCNCQNCRRSRSLRSCSAGLLCKRKSGAGV